MTRGIYKQILKEYRRTLTKAQRRNSYRTKVRWRYPYAGEKRMYSLIKGAFRYYAKKLLDLIILKKPQYPVQTVRRDSFETEMDMFVQGTTETVEAARVSGQLVSSLNLMPLFNAIMDYIRQFNQDELEAYFFKRFGKHLSYTTPWWEDMQKLWYTEFETRLAGSVDAFMYKVRDTVFDYVREERTFDALVGRIKEISTSFTDKQAAFLARDLTGKFNGLIEKEIQTAIGLNYYYWQTAADERVRGRPNGVYASAIPSHWDMDGTVCSWLDVTKVSYDFGRNWSNRTARMPFTHPGMDWQCRCIAVPFDLDLLLQVDKELASEGAR